MSVAVEAGEMVLLLPEAVILTALPWIGLSKASRRIRVMVALWLVRMMLGEAVKVDLLPDTLPIVKATLTVLVKVKLSTVAEMVLVPVEVELRVAVALPFASVAAAG